MYCSLKDLVTESDVEQKLLWPLLTSPKPMGFGLQPAEILTKPNIQRVEIDKGAKRRLYYPDYIIVIAGLPIVVVEAKAPIESLSDALNDARLYANEINASFPSAVNPCIRVIACNGAKLHTSPSDTVEPDLIVRFEEMSVANASFAKLVELCANDTLLCHGDRIRNNLKRNDYTRPLSRVGGPVFQNEELLQNTFGATIVGDYGHIFNPKTRDGRALIAREAYVPSLRRQRYVEPVDRLVRNAVTPMTSAIPIISDSSKPRELTESLQERRTLENQILLLVGSVGAGKSTFVDHLTVVALPKELREKTVWLRVNLNEAPVSLEHAYPWLATAIVAELRYQFSEVDFDNVEIIKKVFALEVNALRKGPLSLLDSSTVEYRTRLADELLKLKNDELKLAKSMARYVCAGPGRLLVIVLDNCDKRTRDEQLTMFQIAQWVQSEFRSLVVLPIRDVTYDAHRHEPPLDTALKGLVFRIEPPRFTDVLHGRVRLALKEMTARSNAGGSLSYQLPNGIRVTYPASDQARYLASILKSLYAHNRFVRQVMTGLAGRDVRKALEIFLDFCMSGHIGEDEIYKIRFFDGDYVLPLSIVARVLLRMRRRFYDGNKSYLKNIVQCEPGDALPDHFVRLSILHWLEQRQRTQGPAGVIGFHRVSELVQSLSLLGHDARRVRAELVYLAEQGCIVPEHLRAERVTDKDLVKITASGVVHLQLMANPDYLAACAEDTFLSDTQMAERIASRISAKGMRGHFARTTTARNAWDLVAYLKEIGAERFSAPEAFAASSLVMEIKNLREAESAIGATEIEVARKLYVGNIPYDANKQDVTNLFHNNDIEVASVSLPKDREADRNRGYAFIEVADGYTAMKALDAEGLEMSGRILKVDESYAATQKLEPTHRGTSKPHTKTTERLYVGNLSYDTDKEGLGDFFAANGIQPKDIYIVIDRMTGRSRGYAFVTVESIQVAEQAIGALHETLLDGRRLKVRPAERRQSIQRG